MAVPGGDHPTRPWFTSKRSTSAPCRACDLGRPVGRAVVDDEDVDVRQLGAQLVEHGREILLLVQGGDEDEGVARGATRPERSGSSAATALAWPGTIDSRMAEHTPTLSEQLEEIRVQLAWVRDYL